MPTIFVVLLSMGTAFAQFGLDLSAGINNSTVEFVYLPFESGNRMGIFISLAPNLNLGKGFKFLIDL
jgi:hypothetical protein